MQATINYAFTFLLASLFLFACNSSAETQEDALPCKIVVIGSSTAEGVGASVPDSAWVNRYQNALPHVEVINLAKGGYMTWNLLPDGSRTPDSIVYKVDTIRNITKALSFDPDGIIINLPSNDAGHYFGTKVQLHNFNIMLETAKEQEVPVWICTSQPRNYADSIKLQIQLDLQDSVLVKYGARSLDFWKGVADEKGHILPQYDSGDGIHLNDSGHRLLVERVLEKGLEKEVCGKE